VVSFAVVHAGHGSHAVMVVAIVIVAMANPTLAAITRGRMPLGKASVSNNIGRIMPASVMSLCPEAASPSIDRDETMLEPPPLPPLRLVPKESTIGAGEVVPPAMTALKEKLTVVPPGMTSGSAKVNTVVDCGVSGSDSLVSPKVAVSVSELRISGFETVIVTVLNCSVVSGSVLV
jgi:hypothetical protein